jgi:plastocyanin
VRRLLPALLVLLALSSSTAQAAAPQRGCALESTAGTVQRWACTSEAIEVGAYAVRQGGMDASALQGAPRPPVDGAITHMDVDVVDEQGRPMPIRRLMLHHIVFANLGRRLGEKADATCGRFSLLDSRTTIPAIGERFYAAGEERATLDLPAGYGLPTAKDDRWLLTWMFMNHRDTPDTGWIRYHVEVDTAPVAPVRPFWLDVRNCWADPQYTVPGGGAPGSTHRETRDFTFPRGGRIVAAAGHVHGGAKALVVSRPGCGDELLRSRPAWGLRSHPFYTVKPVLHEPGPIAMSATSSQEGIPVAAGEPVRLTSEYDGQRPHVRAMGIVVAYVAEGDPPTQRCAPRPADVRETQTTLPHRTVAPVTRIPVSVARGLRARRLRDGATVVVKGFRYSEPEVRLRAGTALRFVFLDPDLHDVTLASGPRGFATRHADAGQVRRVRFPVRGEYRWFCSLHPIAMTGRAKVG